MAHACELTAPGAAAAPATVEVGEEAIVLTPEHGEPTMLAYGDVDDVHDDSYTLRLTDFTGRTFELTKLGKA